MAALWVHGYRTPTSVPGHHKTAIQSLPLTLQVNKDVVIEMKDVLSGLTTPFATP